MKVKTGDQQLMVGLMNKASKDIAKKLDDVVLRAIKAHPEFNDTPNPPDFSKCHWEIQGALQRFYIMGELMLTIYPPAHHSKFSTFTDQTVFTTEIKYKEHWK